MLVLTITLALTLTISLFTASLAMNGTLWVINKFKAPGLVLVPRDNAQRPRNENKIVRRTAPRGHSQAA